MAPHSSTLAWKIPWMEEPGGLQSMGSLRVGHDWVTSFSLPCIGEGNGNPLQYSCLENPRDGGAWRAAVCGVAQSQTRLKRLSSSSSSSSFRQDFPGGTVVNNMPVNAGEARDSGSIPGSGRSSTVGNGNPLQYSYPENSMDRGAWWATAPGVARCWTWLSDSMHSFR